jgi:hypothetical protein
VGIALDELSCLGFYEEVKRKHSAFVTGTVLLAIVAIAGCKRQAVQKDVVDYIFESQARFDAVANPETVTVQRLHLIKDQPLDRERLTAYEHEAPVTLTAPQAAQLGNLFTQPTSYDFSPETGKACIVDYGVVAAFKNKEQVTRVAICFGCNWMGIFDGTNEAAAPIKSDIDCDSIRKQLLNSMKAIFPNDPEIQALKETTRSAR